MSASLVGSEMCIRDSPGAAAEAAGRPARLARRAPVAGSAAIVMDSRDPVSYTHLTLPTICSV
eukprot:12523522-Alexandrium_andersonii.AAC.1